MSSLVLGSSSQTRAQLLLLAGEVVDVMILPKQVAKMLRGLKRQKRRHSLMLKHYFKVHNARFFYRNV